MNLDRLTTLRKNKKWSLQYTADRLGIAKSTYAGYESGYRRPSLEALIEIADLFGTSTDYLLGRIDDPRDGKSKNEPIELTNWGKHKLAVDGALLSEEDIRQMVAFIKVKKQLDAE
ncbi:XRE family transcriptional regulator [Bacillus glycinifermentans]|uniref:Helix-turn-helix transcriptional regulator n=1 Tax=Bacillus glycinifermentans TaxID=1664069 RepID=A0A0J6ENH1_9BACI|nr:MULTISPECIES: helix-turn-helix transcriptional regulator [Bacillus]ATH93740.1 XRE family transcriptional regulator [Bacillus glycinifermentans]KKB75180.1 XRE family transcriptional regulator [Bacillus sp. TH008]KMM59503.1 XRE family transcriptional regulator [Bacillus glycinifermentans]KRT90083.1 XRE family transcriptional regulator [Bacillus glycinifermentans]MBU8786081.1 helix-turn-helix domain-containing protein [Bacillus glycinifermentans]